MSNANKDTGTPKLIIETNSLFGDKRVEQVTVDSNRLDPVETTKNRLISALIHPYFIDAFCDSLCWVSGTAFTVSVLKYTAFLDLFQIPFLIVVLLLAGSAFYCLWKLPETTGAILFRVVLLGIGLFLGELA